MLVATFAGAHTAANPAFCRMLGYSADEFLATTVDALQHLDERRLISEIAESLRAGRTSTDVQRRRWRHKDGHYVSAKSRPPSLNAILRASSRSWSSAAISVPRSSRRPAPGS